MTTLFIAEKPELGRAIADAISTKQSRKDGYILINKQNISTNLASLKTSKQTSIKANQDILITWCFGHLLRLKNPDEYNKELKKWSFDTLPLPIKNMQLKPIEGKTKQVKIIKDLLKQASLIVNAGDPDEEGQLLVDEVLLYLKQNPYAENVKRILINDNTAKAVQKSLVNLKQNIDFKGLNDSAYSRSVADFKYGLNLTRAYTLKARESGNSSVLSVGRVQTPILNLVYTREQEVKNHVKEVFYNLKTDNNFTFNIPKNKLEDKLCKDHDYITQIQQQASSNNDFKITKIELKKEEVSPLLPYNLLELQADANKRYKLKPDHVKDLTQSLREKHKAITYNRSDCQYLTDEHYEQRKEVLKTIKDNLSSFNDIKTLYVNSINQASNKGDTVTLNSSLKSKAFNNANVSAHHAIIPTINNVDISKLSKDELNLYVMIAKRYLIQFLPNRVNEKTKYTAINSTKLEFNATTLKILSLGWQEFYFNKTMQESETEQENQEENSSKYSYKKGDNANFTSFNIAKGETKPKQLYTFATLLKQLTNVTAYVNDNKIKELFKQKDKDKKGESGGIGTPATRDAIIKNLFDRKFLQEQKGKILTTELGAEFLQILPQNAKSVDLTALWAEKQTNIKQGKLSVESFIQEIDNTVTGEIQNIKAIQLNIKPNIEQGKHKCKTCNIQNIVIKGKYGKFETCPKCRTIYKDPNNTTINPNLKLSKHSCPDCKAKNKDGKLIKRPSKKKDKQGKTIYWWGCSNFPSCKFTCFDNGGEPKLN